MSRYHIDTTKFTIINGVEYHADINKDVNIDFSSAHYTVKMWEDVHDAEIELICLVEGTPELNEYRFCPCCGALLVDMRGDTDD